MIRKMVTIYNTTLSATSQRHFSDGLGGGTDNAFIFSVIESYRHNDIYPGKYVNNLLGKLKAFREGTDMTSLVPCYSGL